MANQNDDDNDFFNMDLTTHRYPNGWNEDDWEAELEQHPLFMTKQPENEDLPPIVEALQQLKYGEEDNSRDEIAENHKADGNLYFKAKKYRKAIECYTEGIKQKPECKELNSILHANRSASNFYLENYRSSLMDALKSVELNNKNSKAIQRVIQCLNKLGKYDHLIKFCDNSGLEIPDKEKLRKNAEEKLKIKQRDQRKINLKEKRANDAVMLYKKKVLEELSNRKIRFKGDIFKIVHPAAVNAKVNFVEDGSICFPVLFVYPEVAMCDFVEAFNENDQFFQHLVTMLDDENNLPEWNSNRMFRSDNVTVKFKSLNDLEFQIDKYDTLGQILRKIVLDNLLLTFSITCKS